MVGLNQSSTSMLTNSTCAVSAINRSVDRRVKRFNKTTGRIAAGEVGETTKGGVMPSVKDEKEPN